MKTLIKFNRLMKSPLLLITFMVFSVYSCNSQPSDTDNLNGNSYLLAYEEEPTANDHTINSTPHVVSTSLQSQKCNLVIESSSSEACIGGMVDLDAIVSDFIKEKNASYGWETSSGKLINIKDAQSTLIMGEEDATVTVTVYLGAKTEKTAILIKSNSISATFKTPNVTLDTENAVSIAPELSGNTKGCSFHWNMLTETTPSISAVNPGVYTVTAVNEKGCSTSASVTVFNPNSVKVSDFTLAD